MELKKRLVMDYEKLYKEALVDMQELYNSMKYMSSTDALHTTTALERAFPELKEDDDEKIRKEIIAIFKGEISYTSEENAQKYIAWLEKQGEREDEEDADFTIYYPLKDGKGKYECIPYSFYGTLTSFSEDSDLIKFLRNCFYSEEECEEWIKKQDEQELTNKIEPKFNVGDQIVDNCGYTWKIGGILNQFYILEGVEGGESRPTIEWVDKTCHLWTLKDAKDGDVLCDGIDTVIYKKNIYDMNRRSMYVHCGINNKNEYWYEVGGISPIDYSPATKKQQDLLFQKMKEAGYEWDAEKKEVKKIEDSPLNDTDEDIVEAVKNISTLDLVEDDIRQKPTWSEEDEENLNQLHKFIVEKAYLEYEIDTDDETLYGKWLKLDNWLKSLKDRVQPQWKPEDVHLEALRCVINGNNLDIITLKDLLEQLKKL